jgi:flagellar biosynthetic protein FliR
MHAREEPDARAPFDELRATSRPVMHDARSPFDELRVTSCPVMLSLSKHERRTATKGTMLAHPSTSSGRRGVTSVNPFGLSAAQFETALLVLVRVTFMLALVPIFSQTQIPRLVRFAIGLLLALVLIRTVPVIAPLHGLGDLVVAIASQAFVGLVFGFVAFLLFTGIQFAGEIIDVQIGFAVVNIINPATSQSVTVIGELQLALATLLYLAADAHHMLLAGVAGSFSLVPLPYAGAPQLVAGDVMRFFAESLFIVFEIAAPVAVALFLVNVMLGLMARVAPQMNVFIVGFPIQITVGLIMMIVSIPLLGAVFPALIDASMRQIDAVLRAMAVRA